MFKKFFYFRRRERIAIVILLILLFAIILLLNIEIPSNKNQDTVLFNKAIEEYENQLKIQAQEQILAETKLTTFDPNTDTLIELTNKGVSNKVAKNIINYRAKGGVFRIKSDLKRLYAIDNEIYLQLENYIDLPTKINYPKKKIARQEPAVKPQYTKAFKYAAGTKVNLNTADTTELKKIPGIGTYTAQKIERYRKNLGGFYTITQLDEINIDSNQFKAWFILDSTSIVKTNLNSLTFKELLKHPYTSYEQVSAIFQVKKKQGKLRSTKQLKLLEEFTAEDLDRLGAYFFCE